MKTLTLILSILSLGLVIALSAGATDAPADPNAADRAAITKAAEGFIAAFHKGDAKAVAACWTADGDLGDLSGRVLRGREAIEADFTEFFAENKGLTVRLEVGSLVFPTPDSAIEDGVSSVMSTDGTPPSRARYTNLHVKQNGKWLLASVRESAYIPPNNYEHLRPLDWVIGEWVDANGQGHAARIEFSFTPDGNFIVATRTVDIKGVLLDNGHERIGWDPAAKRIRSWSFETDGGFSESAWSRDGDKWIIKTSAVLHAGGLMTSTNVVTRVDADTITWQSKEQHLNGKSLPDSPVVTMKRLK